MTLRSARKADHQGPQIWFVKPLRYKPAQYATLRFTQRAGERIRSAARTLAGYHQHHAQAALLRRDEKTPQPLPRLALARAVQIKPRIDLHLARGDMADFAAIEFSERRRLARSRHEWRRFRRAHNRRRSSLLGLPLWLCRRRRHRFLIFADRPHARLRRHPVDAASHLRPKVGLLGRHCALAAFRFVLLRRWRLASFHGSTLAASARAA